ncbi:nitrous oxide reductase accessory protein NosL [Hydrogenimonas sp.]
MKKVLFIALAIIGFMGAAHAVTFDKSASSQPQLLQKGEQKYWCPVCGMNLKMFYKTSHAVELDDGTKKQYCSIRCLAADWPNVKSRVKRILVVDAATEKLIDAKSAFYVVGSKVKGTMSMTSKLAFATKEEAESFRKKYGGKIVDFDTAFAMAQKALAKESMMMAKRKQQRIYPMGEKIYKRMCQKVDPSAYAHINELKAALRDKGLCKPMKERQLQAVSLYLWEVVGGHAPAPTMQGCRCGKGCSKAKAKAQGCGCGAKQPARSSQKGCGCGMKKQMPAAKGCGCKMKSSCTPSKTATADLSKQDKCPVCGMFVYKHPKWAAFIYYEKDGKLRHLAFDGVKDLMKFYFEPNRWGAYGNIRDHIKKIVVRDYYTLKPIWAKRAWFVVGSDVYGPMGNELIPFSTKKAAESFMKDHRGTKLLRFDEITKEMVYKLDE